MKICVIGGGAAGMFAAIYAARAGAKVVLLEKNEKLGKKLYITGKGRCNVTNDCSVTEFLENVVHGEKFLRSAIYGFQPSDTVSLLEEAGLSLVTERGNRVFPLSGKSSDVIKTLAEELDRAGVDVRLKTAVKAVKREGDGFKVQTAWENCEFDKVIVATGGVSYPSTGSTGDGYRFAKEFGLKTVAPAPALAPILTVEDVKPLEGLSLKNVCLTAFDARGNSLRSEFGEMLFTARGLSGPIALSVSSYINRTAEVELVLDLKPALTEEKLDARILRDFEDRKNQDVKNVTRGLLPDRLNTYVLNAAEIDETKKVNSVTKEERARLAHALKNLLFTVKANAPFEEAIITSGGVDLKELSPGMECRTVPGLYFAGEVLDCDALTGGFNLQIAFATGVAAARNAVKELAE